MIRIKNDPVTMTKFQTFCAFMMMNQIGSIVENIATMLSPGYHHAMVAATVIALIFLVGPRIEVWLIKGGWL